MKLTVGVGRNAHTRTRDGRHHRQGADTPECSASVPVTSANRCLCTSHVRELFRVYKSRPRTVAFWQVSVETRTPEVEMDVIMGEALTRQIVLVHSGALDAPFTIRQLREIPRQVNTLSLSHTHDTLSLSFTQTTLSPSLTHTKLSLFISLARSATNSCMKAARHVFKGGSSCE